MTDRSRASTARAGGRPLARAAVLALLTLLGPAVLAQPVTWEVLPGVRRLPTDPDRIAAVGFLRGEGAQADDPAADTLVAIGSYGPFLYNPSGAAGAAGSNGDWGAWHPLCTNSYCSGADGVVTAAGSLVIGSPNRQVSRSTDRGRTWTHQIDEVYPSPLFESALPALAGPDGAPALFAGIGDAGETARSLDDGAPGSWVQVGSGLGYPMAFGDVPPSPALPDGRLVLGVWGGVRTSDDGGLTYVRAAMPGPGTYIVWSLAFAPDPAHPYGGVAFAGAQRAAVEFGGAEVHRSDDGGATWSVAHRFTAAEVGLPPPDGGDVTEVEVYATADGALWAGVSLSTAFGVPARGGVVRSVDGGATWARADAGFEGGDGRGGYAVSQFGLSRAGVLYAATSRGVWRTTTAVVAAEAGPVEGPGGVALSVEPNPAGSSSWVTVTLAEPGEVAVTVYDLLGRAVQAPLAGALAAGPHRAAVDVSALAPGVYVVRAAVANTAGGPVVRTARLTVAR